MTLGYAGCVADTCGTPHGLRVRKKGSLDEGNIHVTRIEEESARLREDRDAKLEARRVRPGRFGWDCDWCQFRCRDLGIDPPEVGMAFKDDTGLVACSACRAEWARPKHKQMPLSSVQTTRQAPRASAPLGEALWGWLLLAGFAGAMFLVGKALSEGVPLLALVFYLLGGIAATFAAWGVWAFWFGGLLWLGEKLTQRRK
jgi:hypothetical protein